ncbi:Glutathione S-transferase 1 [Candida viswanathii]|uniref:Glutathione S-transferase 1 n=1 Tax=Candida viswanathii TaxID=5486 RepID=A0A367XWQ7_9ASCO|nr:Glutathione S-transferase 1 [Candida viswanathii]
MTEPKALEDKFILHWLDDSRAHRILWLLDILQLDYEVKIYLRHPETWRSPLQLFDVHQLGKSPVLEIVFADGRPQIKMSELGFIMQYLLRYYDPRNILNPVSQDLQLKVDYFLHYAEGTLQPIQMALLVNSTAKHVAPFGSRKIVSTITKAINNGYYKHEWYLNMKYLDQRLLRNGTGYFVGDGLTGADVILSFPIYENVFDNLDGVKEILADKRDLKKMYPNLYKWSKMIRNNRSYKRISQMMDENVEDLIAKNPRFDYGKE